MNKTFTFIVPEPAHECSFHLHPDGEPSTIFEWGDGPSGEDIFVDLYEDVIELNLGINATTPLTRAEAFNLGKWLIAAATHESEGDFTLDD